MKYYLLFFFVAYAAPYEAYRISSEDAVKSFITGMEPSLHQVFGETQEIKRFEGDIKEELAKYLRDAFDKALQRITDTIKSGNLVHEEALKQLHELKEKMKELNIEDDEVADKMLDELKTLVDEKLKQILEKFGIIDKRSIDFDELMNVDDNILGDLNLRNLILRLKEMILEKMDVDSLKASLAKLVGTGTQKLCEWLTNKGKEKVINFIDRVLEKDEERKKRSDLYQEIKDYFEDLDLEIKQKFSKFGEWVKNVVENGLDKSKSKIENVKLIAKQLLEKSKLMSKDVAVQALGYLKEYKLELGEFYDKVRSKLIERIMDYTD